MKPRTTVLMPAYNAEATIRPAVASVLAQTVGELELIVVDDGSLEPVAGVLGDVCDARLRVVRHDRNRDVSAARNTALARASAPLVSQLDADCSWEPEYLEWVLPRFGDADVGLVYANAAIIGHPRRQAVTILDPAPHPVDTFPALARENPIPGPTVTMRTEAVRAVRGYAGWLWGGEDYHLYLKLAQAGWRFSYVHEALATFEWPGTVPRRKSCSARRMRWSNVKLAAVFAARHPRTPGVKEQILPRLRTLR